MDKLKSNTLVTTMEGWFKAAPALPKGAVDFLVMIAPWFALIFGVLGVLGSITALGVFGTMSPYASMYGASTSGMWQIAIIGSLISSALTVAAFPGLKALKLNGWMMIFWAQIVSVVSSVLGMNLVGGLIGAVIGFYILFQVKPRYK